MILIISSSGDNGVNKVCDWLDHYDRPYLLANEHTQFGYRLSDRSVQVRLGTGSYQPVTAGWIRNPYLNLGNVENIKEESLRKWVGMDLQKNQEFLFHFFKRSLDFLGTPYPLDINKLQVFEAALAQGLSVPAYRVVCDKPDLLDFVCLQGSVVTKSIGWNINIPLDGQTHVGYTKLLSAPEIAALPNRFMPSFLQKFVDAEFEIRSLFVGEKQFSMAQVQKITTIPDIRARTGAGDCFPFTLPLRETLLLNRLLQELGLDFCVFDILYAGETYWLIDINPSGQFTRLSRHCHFPIESSIAQLLIARQDAFER